MIVVTGSGPVTETEMMLSTVFTGVPVGPPAPAPAEEESE